MILLALACASPQPVLLAETPYDHLEDIEIDVAASVDSVLEGAPDAYATYTVFALETYLAPDEVDRLALRMQQIADGDFDAADLLDDPDFARAVVVLAMVHEELPDAGLDVTAKTGEKAAYQFNKLALAKYAIQAAIGGAIAAGATGPVLAAVGTLIAVDAVVSAITELSGPGSWAATALGGLAWSSASAAEVGFDGDRVCVGESAATSPHDCARTAPCDDLSCFAGTFEMTGPARMCGGESYTPAFTLRVADTVEVDFNGFFNDVETRVHEATSLRDGTWTGTGVDHASLLIVRQTEDGVKASFRTPAYCGDQPIPAVRAWRR